MDVVQLNIITLARQTSAEWILPTAFYRICELVHEDTIINGEGMVELDPIDKVACMTAIRFLETTGASNVLKFLTTPMWIPGCTADPPEDCTLSRAETRAEAELWRDYAIGKAPYLPFELWSTDDWERLNVCGHCLSTMKSAAKEAKEVLWKTVPELFGLPSWIELEKMKAEALK